jgi:hypothetical protein
MPSHAATSSDEAPTPAFRGDASAGRNTVRFEDVVAVEPRCRTAVGSRRHARTSNRGANGAVYGRVPCCQQVGRDQVRGRDPPTIRTCAGLNAAPIRRPDAAGRSGLAPPRTRPRTFVLETKEGCQRDAQGSPRIPQGPRGLSAISPEQTEGLPWSRVDPEGQVPPPHPRRSGRLGHRPPAASEGANEEGRRRGRTRGQKPANWPRLPRPSPRDRR